MKQTSMESSKLSIKFYVEESSSAKLTDIVPVFHSWIQFHSIADHLLIDVADYAHVPDGPGIVLVAHEANFYLDRFDGRLGLTYSRKTPLPGTLADRLRLVFGAALEACQLVETNPTLGSVKFRTDEANLKINDRLLAPNTPETFTAVRPDLERISKELWGSPAKLEHRGDNKRLFEVAISTSSAPDLATLLTRSKRQPTGAL
jgi:hypothetical protein